MLALKGPRVYHVCDMTTLLKPVRRSTAQEYCVLHHRQPKTICLALLPGDTIEFHEKRGRRKFRLTIDGAFLIAVRMTVEAARRKRLAERAAKKKA